MAFASRAVCLVLVSLALCQAASGESAYTKDIMEAFQTITTLSSNLRDVTQGINFINPPLDGPKIGHGLQGITVQVEKATAMLSGNPTTLSNPDAVTVAEVLETFVTIDHELLRVVMGKHGVFTFPFAEPIREALVSLEAAVDKFALALIAKIPSEKSTAQDQFGALGVTLDEAIRVYGGR